jgi:hypothetical protein
MAEHYLHAVYDALQQQPTQITFIWGRIIDLEVVNQLDEDQQFPILKCV